MSTSFFSMPTDQNQVLRNTHFVNSSGEIRKEPPRSRGRRPGSKKSQEKQKKPCLRGMGIAKMEKLIEEEKKKKIAAVSGDMSATLSPNNTDPVVVLQGFPSSLGGCRNNRIYCGGVGSGQILINPWSFVENSSHELSSSVPNLQMYNTCFKKKRLDEDQNNIVRSNGGGFSKYTMNGYDHLLQQDQKSQVSFSDHTISRSSAPVTNHTVSMNDIGSYMEANPRNGSGRVKEYEFFPGKYGKGATSFVGDSSPNTSSSTIDLSLKL